MSIDIGQKAPDFSALVCDGEKFQPFKLSDNLGSENVVLAFFPFAFSSVCTDEFCTFRDSMGQFGELNAKIYGISIDSPFALNAYIKDQGFNFNMLSDFNKDISREYGVLNENAKGLRGVAKRSVFVINKRGEVAYQWISEDAAVLPDFEDLKGALQTLQG